MTVQNKAGVFGTADAATLGARVLKEYFQLSATTELSFFTLFQADSFYCGNWLKDGKGPNSK